MAHAQLNTIGVTLLRRVTTNLNGDSIRVAQVEANESSTNFEVDPASSAVQQPISLFTYTSSSGTAYYFPNSVGTGSGHAAAVGGNFYGLPAGVATNIAHVDNEEANYFYNSIINAPLPGNINDPVVNQSFIFTEPDGSHSTVSDQQAIDSAYDSYAAQYNTLFISGAGNGGPINPSATCYNGIGVGVSDGSSSFGPTPDNGRAKPDIIAPGGVTSLSTPYVAGAASLLIQAGQRGDGGSDINSAADIRTLKALLLNGAVKPAGWTNIPPSPLDTRYGAGILNVFNSYEQLAGGKHGYTVSVSVPTGSPHPPPGAAGTISALNGWDFNINTSGATSDEINHYYFSVTNGVGKATFAATATLVWNRQQGRMSINNLNLFLYNAANSNLVACSTSVVDNVEHIFVPKLTPGRYDLQVWKAGGIPNGSIVSYSETYALAWTFFTTPLSATQSGNYFVLSWPVYPDGFVLASAANLTPPVVWSTNNPAPTVANNMNWVVIGKTSALQFFRLQPP
jgi:hypothetical protein